MRQIWLVLRVVKWSKIKADGNHRFYSRSWSLEKIVGQCDPSQTPPIQFKLNTKHHCHWQRILTKSSHEAYSDPFRREKQFHPGSLISQACRCHAVWVQEELECWSRLAVCTSDRVQRDTAGGWEEGRGGGMRGTPGKSFQQSLCL